MTNEQKNRKKKFRNFCEGMDFTEMMRNMMNQRGEGLDSHCAEMMKKMMDKDSGCCDFDCSEMMARMKTMCCQPQEEKEETAEPVKEPQGTTQ